MDQMRLRCNYGHTQKRCVKTVVTLTICHHGGSADSIGLPMLKPFKDLHKFVSSNQDHLGMQDIGFSNIFIFCNIYAETATYIVFSI